MLFRSGCAFWGGGEGTLQVVGDRQDLEEQGLARQAGLALALFGGAAAEVGEVGGGALMGGDLLVPLQTVASGRWYSGTPGMSAVQHAFWAVARCVPCGPLDRHQFLRSGELLERIRGVRRVIEHTDEVLRFGSERDS